MPNDSNSTPRPRLSNLGNAIALCLILGGLAGGIRLIVWGIATMHAEGLGFWGFFDVVLGVIVLINWGMYLYGAMSAVLARQEAEADADALDAEDDPDEDPKSPRRVLYIFDDDPYRGSSMTPKTRKKKGRK